MAIIDRYIFRQTLMATVFVTVVLTCLVFLTQSLRFLDMVVNAGASGFMIWVQTFLYLPGFFEIILPIGMVAAVLFIYNRLTMDSELVVLRALGFSPLRLAKPAIILSVLLGIVLFMMMGWLAPASRSEAILIRQELRAKMSTLLFREGVFNEAGKNIMVYIRDRDREGNLHGLVIHDTRDSSTLPSTIIAARGILVSTEQGQQVLVYDGVRQEVDKETGKMRQLNFDRYTVDLPESAINHKNRLIKPEERSLSDLFATIRFQEENAVVDKGESLRVEVQKRILIPFLVPGFSLIGLAFLLIGGHDRRGQGKRIMGAIGCVMALEIMFLLTYNLSKQSAIGFPLMLLTILIPFLVSAILFIKEDMLFRARKAAGV